MRLSTAEVRDVSPSGRRAPGGSAGLVSRLHRRANKRAGGRGGPRRSNHITPRPHTRSGSTRHLSVRRYGDGPGRA